MYVKHNQSKTPEYRCWLQIKARCFDPNHRAYPNYGGRGISMHPEWVHDFVSFFEYVGPRPSSKHSLDRYPNNDGNYEPGNVRWATWDEQANNRRRGGTGAGTVKYPSTGKVTNFKHGMVQRPEYRAWVSMKNRCFNRNNPSYAEYGGRGISIHPEWVNDFVAFFEHIGPRPSPEHSLDRYPDNDGNYEPGNVRWATKKQQSENRRPIRTGSSHGNHEHGGTKTPEYKAWGSIKTRCFNPKHDSYPRYGGTGVTMCARWKDDFTSFLGDLGSRPSPDHVIGRKNLDGSYSCGKCDECLEKGWTANCAWVTKLEQNRNRRSVKLSPEKVQMIRKRAAGGVRYEAIRKEFGIGLSLVGKIVRGENWA